MVVSIKRKIKDSFLSAGNSGNNMPDKGAQIRPCNGMGGMAALYRKEMSDHIRSKRFLIVLGLILLTSCASIYGALTGLSDAVASDSSYIFLKLFTLSGSSIPSFTSFIALLGPFVGLSLGFDAINSERSEGTLNRLVAQPIYRDAVINGKFLQAPQSSSSWSFPWDSSQVLWDFWPPGCRLLPRKREGCWCCCFSPLCISASGWRCLSSVPCCAAMQPHQL